MAGPFFLSWFNEVLIKHCGKLTGAKALFFDRHASHILIEIINSAIDNDIELICLPQHSSSFLQPLDVVVFKTLKYNWRKYLHTFFMETRFKNVEKENFFQIYDFLYKKAFLDENAIIGFETFGLYPLNRDKIIKDTLAIGTAFVKYIS